jgi:hypothetical protein
MRAQIDPGSTCKAGAPTGCLNGAYAWSVPSYGGRHYDIPQGGRRFVLLKAVDPERASLSVNLIVVPQWFEGLKQRVVDEIARAHWRGEESGF